MQSDLQLFHHTHIDNHALKTLFLLHGTGGNENDFLFLDALLDKKYNILSLRGNVDEQGMNRFFRRHAFGMFDQENIKEEVEKLKKFVETWIKKHETSADRFIFLGYSNGANMILATLFYYPQLIQNAILLHPMLPFEPKKGLKLSSHSLFVSYGLHDQMVSPDKSQKIIEVLQSHGATLKIADYPSGHEISNKEIHDIVQYLKKDTV